METRGKTDDYELINEKVYEVVTNHMLQVEILEMKIVSESRENSLSKGKIATSDKLDKNNTRSIHLQILAKKNRGREFLIYFTYKVKSKEQAN